ncbi:MAG TPA: carboxypeptidase regulatory-like domain-containing protein [Planctomycetota bacterium]|nr:carboxypeptidase regulatory-like domain-containing protein [Planctomycetota bacterium]
MALLLAAAAAYVFVSRDDARTAARDATENAASLPAADRATTSGAASAVRSSVATAGGVAPAREAAPTPHGKTATEIETAGIDGHVVDAATGKPIARFSAHARRAADPRTWARWALASDASAFESAEGAFSIRDIRPGLYRVAAYADGYALAESDEVEAPRGSVAGGVIVRLSPGATVRGRVVEAGTAKPVGHARVMAFRPNEDIGGAGADLDVETADDGRFVFPGVEAGSLRFRVSHDAYPIVKTDPVEIAVGGRELDPIELARGGAVEGIAIDSKGAPAPGIDVWADRPAFEVRSAKADSSGAFRIEGLASGEWTVSLGPRNRNEGPQANAIVEAGATTRVEFRRGRVLRGHVTRGDRPVVDARIGAYRDGVARSGRTDSDGRFELVGVSSGQNSISVDGASSRYTEWIVVPDAAETDLEIAIPIGGSVEGRVVLGAARDPVADALVKAEGVMPAGANRLASASARTDADGRFVIPELPASSYDVSVSRTFPPPDARTSPRAPVQVATRRVEVAEGRATKADFAVESGGRVRIEVVTPEGLPAKSHTAWLVKPPDPAEATPAQLTDESGLLVLDAVPAGTYRALARPHAAPFGASEPIEVRADSDVQVRVQLPRVVKTTLHATTESGAPAPIDFIAVDDGSNGPRTPISWGAVGPTPDAATLTFPISTKVRVQVQSGKLAGEVSVDVADVPPPEIFLKLK